MADRLTAYKTACTIWRLYLATPPDPAAARRVIDQAKTADFNLAEMRINGLLKHWLGIDTPGDYGNQYEVLRDVIAAARLRDYAVQTMPTGIRIGTHYRTFEIWQAPHADRWTICEYLRADGPIANRPNLTQAEAHAAAAEFVTRRYKGFSLGIDFW